MAGIIINGTPLHRVQMLLEPEMPGVASRLSYPSDWLRAVGDGDDLELLIPGFLALELYRLGLLSEEDNAVHEITVDGKHLGAFYFSDLHYPRRPGQERVRVKMFRNGP